MATMMQVPFSMLTRLHIGSNGGNALVLPTEFLGGSAPCLRTIRLYGIPYPALPSLLLSASNLVELRLHEIPPTGYISPESMVVGLAALPRLEIVPQRGDLGWRDIGKQVDDDDAVGLSAADR